MSPAAAAPPWAPLGRGALMLGACGLLGGLLGACGVPTGALARPAGSGAVTGAVTGTVTATADACAWHGSALAPGAQRFTVRDHSAGAVGVALVGSDTGGVYAQVTTLAPGTARTLRVVLPAGRFRWRCTSADTTGTAVSAVLGSPGPGPRLTAATPVLVLTTQEATDAVAAYRAAVQQHLAPLVAATDQLRSDATAVSTPAGLARARRSWLAAHLDYARLGAAYGTFGDLDGVVDGLPEQVGAAGAVRSTGFLRVEHDLWSPAPPPTLPADAAALDSAVHTVAQEFPQDPTQPSDLPRAAHEVLEVAVERELSGRSDQGSHSALATVRADVDATTMVLDALAPALQPRDPGLLARSRADLASLATQLDALRHPDGTWPALAAVPTTAREDLDARTGAALEQLALVPGELPMPPAAGDP